MVSTAAKYRLYTFEDFCDLIAEGQKADLIDGVIYMASPDNIEHYSIYLWLSRLLADFLEDARIAGEIFGSRIAFRLGLPQGPEPDLAFVRGARLHLVRKTFVDGPPDLAIEIVSPDSIERDYEKKRRQYEEARVSEYWIIDPLKETVTCLRLGRNGKYKKIRSTTGILRSKIIPGFWLRTAWLWQKPLPRKMTILAEILSDHPRSSA
jgi:Uma2 family endonuclease